jgi:hypothetical protein
MKTEFGKDKDIINMFSNNVDLATSNRSNSNSNSRTDLNLFNQNDSEVNNDVRQNITNDTQNNNLANDVELGNKDNINKKSINYNGEEQGKIDSNSLKERGDRNENIIIVYGAP